MLDISPAGLLGAVIGTAVAALVYRPLSALVERGFARLPRPQGAAEREPIERGLLFRIVLAADILVFAGAGYWLGAIIGG
jgi:uncharacterized membrane protein